MAINCACIIKSCFPKRRLNSCLPMRNLNLISFLLCLSAQFLLSLIWIHEFSHFYRSDSLPHHTLWEWGSSHVGLELPSKVNPQHDFKKMEWISSNVRILCQRLFTRVLQRVRIAGNKHFQNNTVVDLLFYVRVTVGGGKNTLKKGRDAEKVCSFLEGKNKPPLLNVWGSPENFRRKN